MDIHTRTVLIIGGTIFSLIIVFTGITQFFILSTYSAIEEQESVSDTGLVTSQIQAELTRMGESIHSWAVSDTTYRYVQAADQKETRAIFEDPAFQTSLKLDGVILYNASGTPVYSASFAQQDPGRTALAKELVIYFGNHPEVFPNSTGEKRNQGVIQLPHGPIMAAIHSILPVSGVDQGSGKGTLVVYRYFGPEEIATVEQDAHLPIRITSLDNPDETDAPVIAYLNQPEATPVATRILNETTISGFTVIHSIDGRPILLLEVLTPRHLNTQATSSMRVILVLFLITGIMFVIATELLLNRYILPHLSMLDTSLKEIGNRCDPSRQIPETGDDEIASLKQSINRMLRELDGKERDLAEAHMKANRYLDIYLDVLTYEIKNSLMAYWSYADILQNEDGEKRKTCTDNIIGLIRRNRTVIQNIETISSIYKNPPSCIPMDLDLVVNRVVAEFPKIAISREGCGIFVLADDKLGIVLSNIISNSIRYGGNDVLITIGVMDAGDGKVEISISDTGPGIPDANKPNIFDRFMKGSEKRSSYGLGLHIVKMLIEAYGGRVWADDRVAGQPGMGAVIRFTLFRA